MIAGIDGTVNGWVVIVCETDLDNAEALHVSRLSDLPRKLKIAGVDVPIGLSEEGPREADRLARKALGEPRRRSVFPSPVRSALGARSWKDACARSERADGRRMSMQTFAILHKIAEADEFVRTDPWARRVLREVHPELSFARWAGGPMRFGKKSVAGREERLALIAAAFGRGVFDEARRALRGRRVAFDDVADAFAVAWTTARIHAGVAERFPPGGAVDAEGLPMHIWA